MIFPLLLITSTAKQSFSEVKKPLVFETDHRNLIRIESSLVPIVVHWRVAISSSDIFHALLTLWLHG
jgi:hypothetical protein